MQSNRLQQLPPYLFADLDRKKKAVAAKGIDLIDLSIGDPDLPTPGYILDAFCRAAREPKMHRYPPYSGLEEFRQAAANYLSHSRGVKMVADTEILTLIGSKEGIAHTPASFINGGDVVLVPSPGYPVYSSATLLCGGVPYEMPLKKENDFLPDFSAIPKDVLKKARLMFLNYPNNPTSATATVEFFNEAVAFAKRHDIILAHDAAYFELTYGGYTAPSIFEAKGAREVAIEFHSLSKTFNMTGWRLGFAAGSSELLAPLAKMKTNYDSSATAAVQLAGAAALASYKESVARMCGIYQKRRAIFADRLSKLGWKVHRSNATFYVWVELPKGIKSAEFASNLMEKTGVVATPGIGFGSYGEGYIRFSLTSSDERIEEAIHRLSSANM